MSTDKYIVKYEISTDLYVYKLKYRLVLNSDKHNLLLSSSLSFKKMFYVVFYTFFNNNTVTIRYRSKDKELG